MMSKSNLFKTSALAALLGAGILGIVVFSVDALANEVTLNDGIYTAEQAEAGKPLFEKSCSTCHNADFYKTALQTYNGQPLVYLFESIITGMPMDNPGSLMDSEYENIMAHILAITGFPAGKERLSYDGDVMSNTKIVPAP